MTVPDKVWINWNPAVAAQGQISTEAITVLSYISTMPYPAQYTSTDLSNALIAAAFEAAANHADIFIAYLRAGAANVKDELAASIRTLTPPDAQAALQAMIDAAERRGMRVAIDLINENTSPMVAPPTWSHDEAEGYENGQMDAAQSFIHKIRAKIGGAL